MSIYKTLKSTAERPFKSISTLWDNYWFHPGPVLNLAICRIIIIGFQLQYLLTNSYGNRVLAEADIPGRVFEPLIFFQVLNLPFPWDAPPSIFLSTVFALTVISGISSLFGFKTRLSLLIFAITNLYLQTYLYSFGRHHHTETLLLIALFLLAFGPAGKALSIDDLRWQLRQNKRKKSVQPANALQQASIFARWPLLATQWLFALVYLSAGVNKVNADGPGLVSAEWMNGYTLQYYLIKDGLQWGSDLGVWLSQFHVFAILSSWFAVLFEVTFWLVLPFPKLIALFIPLGIALHVGIWMAQRAPFFHYLALYAVFIPWTAFFKVIAHRFRWTQNRPQATLLYSKQGRWPVRLATLISYFDWFNQVECVELESHHHLLSQQPQGRKSFLLKTLNMYWVKGLSTGKVDGKMNANGNL